MKPLVITLMASLALFSVAASSQSVKELSSVEVRQSAQKAEVIPGYFIVRFKDQRVHQSLLQTPETNALIKKEGGITQNIIETFNMPATNKTYGMNALRALPFKVSHIRSLSMGNDLIKVSLNGRNNASVMLELLQTGQFELVEQKRIYQPLVFDSSEYNDELYHMQEHFGLFSDENRAGAGFATLRRGTVNNLGRKVRIAVIDSGSYRHQDVNFVDGYDFVTYEGLDENGDIIEGDRDDDPTDEYTNEDGETCNSGHGLAVSSIIAATANNGVGMVGAIDSELVEIVPVRSLGCYGGSNVDIYESVLWAAGESIPGVPDIETPVDIVNMSLGGFSNSGCPQTEQEVFDRLRELGITVLVAAGNENMDADGSVPAACADVVTVGASDTTGDKADFSNYGQKVDIVAPGTQIITANLDTEDDNLYSSGQGTSFAAPLVAATAASLKLTYPELTAPQIEAILKSNVTDNRVLSGRETTCSKLGCGTGILKAGQSINAIKEAANITQFDVAYRYESYESTADRVWLDKMSRYADACNLVRYRWGNLGTTLSDISYNLFTSEDGEDRTLFESVTIPQKVADLASNTLLSVQACVGNECGEIVDMPRGDIREPLVCQ